MTPVQDRHRETIYFDENAVMNATNGHDKTLVEHINLLHSHKGYHTEFYEILTLLATRDLNEIIEKGLLREGENLTEEFVKANASDILTQVCDDTDLRTILSYCKFDPANFQTRYYIIDFKIPPIGTHAVLPVAIKGNAEPTSHPTYQKMLKALATEFKGNVYTRAREVDKQTFNAHFDK